MPRRMRTFTTWWDAPVKLGHHRIFLIAGGASRERNRNVVLAEEQLERLRHRPVTLLAPDV